MTEVGHADISRLLQFKRNECNSIVTARKRKLRELYVVATHVGDLPENGFANPDSQSTTPAEWQFQQANDILQGKVLNEQNIPTRPPISLDVLKRSLAGLKEAAIRQASQKSPLEPKKEPATLVTRVERSIEPVTPSTPNAPGTNGPTPIPSHIPTPKTAHQFPPSGFRLPPAAQRPDPSKTNATPTSLSPAPPAPNGVPNDKQTPTATATTGVAATVQNRSAQVTFPPGTKGLSPDGTTTPKSSAVDAKDGMPEAIKKGLSGERSTPSAKPANDAARAHDAASSPGSTAPSAATPAIHEASTDTSPDNEGLQYQEDSDIKSEAGPDNDADLSASVPEKPEPVEHKSQNEVPVPESAEDQLLQESIQSAATAATIREKTPVSIDGTKPATDAQTANMSQPKPVETQPLPAGGESTQSPITTSAPNASQMEIPDSQEEGRDSMDVDGPDGSTDPAGPQVQKASSPPESNLPPSSAPVTPGPNELAPKETSQAPERAVTRVSSGAMRLKSVNEIVGSTARSSTDRNASTKATQSQLTPVTSTPQSPASRHRHPTSHKRDRSKGQISTVVFGKQPKRVDDKSVMASQKESFQPSDDYFTPLFLQGFTASSNLMQPIEKILFHANKTIATPDTNLAIQDHQACKVLRRVYQLQQYEKWSLRQIKRCPEPTRPPSQWDVVLQEMKWMRTDFREERKWKAAVAKNLAHACAQWHEASPEERKALQVPALIPPKAGLADDTSMAEADEEGIDYHPTPDLISSGDVDSPQVVDELVEEFPETVAPSAIFTLQEDDVVFGLRRTAASDQLLDELPIYGSPLKVPRFDLTGPEFDPDAHWKRPALPLSKYVEGQMKVISDGPPRKRSRFNYKNEDSEDEGDGGFVSYGETENAKLSPISDAVALFNPESKPIRDRLHAGHQFRPPSEHPMPTQSFYECRSPSQWVMAEDDELRGLVRDYSYNWSLISSMLTTRSLFVSGAERRTPWECFERWINLEGLPADMQKTQYFKAYNSRIEAAQRVIAQQNQLAAQQASASGGAITPVRRRQSTPLRVERRRNQKHLTLIDAMRKLAKKRETTIQKQQHTASQSVANKKTNDAMAQRPTKTPRDYSLLRWERDQALAEKMAQYAQRQEAQRRAALQARVQGQAAQMAGTPGVPQAAQTPNHVAVNNAVNGVNRPNMPNPMAAAAAAQVAANQARPRMAQMQAPANGMPAGMPPQMGGGLMPPTPMNGVPQAQMQALQGQHRMQMPNQQTDANLMLRAQRISEQQRAAVQIKQAQQQQQPGGSGTPVPVPQQASPPLRNGMNGINQQSFINNAQAIMASFNTNNNGHATPPASGLHMPTVPNGTSPGPRVQAQIPPSIAAQLQQLETTFRAKNPSISAEQARQLATEHLTRAMMAQRQSAMNAAAGGSGQPGLANSIAATTSPHQYAAALLRQQQQQQAQQQAQRQATPASASPAQAQAHPQQQVQHPPQQQQPQQQHHQQQQHQQQLQHQQQQQQPPQPQHHQQQQQQQQPQQQQQQPQQQQPQPQQQQQQRQASGSATPSLPPATPTPTVAAPAANATPTPAPAPTPVAK